MIRLLAFLCALPATLWAEAPRVVTDIAPIHSLTAQVMAGVGTPDLLLPPGTDPHDFALRPSDAQRLGAADLIIWTGPDLLPWLADPFDTLAPDATRIALLDSPDWRALPVRGQAGIDPHGWLDPVVARHWVATIANALTEADPANAATYAVNATTAIAALEELEVTITAQLSTIGDAPYILPHDAYQYFETRFGLTAAASIAGVDARPPGPAQIAALRDKVRDEDITCVFSDAEIGTRWADLLTEGTTARTARLDATGAGLSPGPDLYPALIRNMADAFIACLTRR